MAPKSLLNTPLTQTAQPLQASYRISSTLKRASTRPRRKGACPPSFCYSNQRLWWGFFHPNNRRLLTLRVIGCDSSHSPTPPFQFLFTKKTLGVTLLSLSASPAEPFPVSLADINIDKGCCSSAPRPSRWTEERRRAKRKWTARKLDEEEEKSIDWLTAGVARRLGDRRLEARPDGKFINIVIAVLIGKGRESYLPPARPCC